MNSLGRGDRDRLPPFPTRPEIGAANYPSCRDDYLEKGGARQRAEAINRCTAALDDYYRDTMLPYREAMIGYQSKLSALYSDRVADDRSIPIAVRQQYYRDMLREHSASAPDGKNQADYRAIETRYRADRSHLADRYCFNTGCVGYAVPEELSKPQGNKGRIRFGIGGEAVIPLGRHGDTPPGCGRSRLNGQAVGGLLGGIAGAAAGLDVVGGAASGLLGAVLAGELVCKLDDREQKVAADATLAVIKKEKVGATTNWVSPTREGVSGSSTITDLRGQPNGSRCISITDIAIIDGEETRVTKRMCREGPGKPYQIER